jgi:hypothetical protein
MNVDAIDGELVHLETRLRDILVEMGRLTPEAAAHIDKAVGIWQLGFGETFVQLGLITREELEKATQAAQELPPIAPDDTVGASQGISLNRGMPVKYVGMVKAGPSLMLVHDPGNTYSEQIRALRTELLLLNGASDSGNAIVILSPCQGECRTQLCAELAIAFSQLGRHTLLVDADLRRPRIHALFQSQNTLALGRALALGGVPQPLGVESCLTCPS